MKLEYKLGEVTPHGGFQYYDAATNWAMPGAMSKTWTTAVRTILEHDLANPQIPNRCQDLNCARRKLDEYTYARLKKLNVAEQFYDTDESLELQRLITAFVAAPKASRCCGGSG